MNKVVLTIELTMDDDQAVKPDGVEVEYTQFDRDGRGGLDVMIDLTFGFKGLSPVVIRVTDSEGRILSRRCFEDSDESCFSDGIELPSEDSRN